MPEQEKSIGRKILSFFIEEETPNAANSHLADAPKVSIPQSIPQSVPQSTSFTSSPKIDGGEVDKKFVTHFVQVLEKANFQGADYFEYMQALKSLSGLGLSEDKQFQAAWASFKAMGNVSDVSILTTTANQYIEILGKDRQGFLKDVEAAVNERVGGLQNEVKKMQTENEAMSKQIIELQNKINENNAQITKVTGDISEQSSKITVNKSNYEITYSSFVEQIKADIRKISEYLAP